MLKYNYINYKYIESLQPEFDPEDKTGLRKNKLDSVSLGQAYEDLGFPNLSKRVFSCCNNVIYSKDECGNAKIDLTYRCKDKLCPICSKVVAKQRAKDLDKITSHIKDEHPNSTELHVICTLKNVSADYPEKIKHSFHKLNTGVGYAIRNYSRLKKHFIGMARRDEHPPSIDSDGNLSINIHCHLRMTFDSNFMNSSEFVDEDELSKLLKKAMKLDYLPNVFIEKIGKKSKSTVKHTMKDEDEAVDHYITKPYNPEDKKLTKLKSKDLTLQYIYAIKVGTYRLHEFTYSGEYRNHKRNINTKKKRIIKRKKERRYNNTFFYIQFHSDIQRYYFSKAIIPKKTLGELKAQEANNKFINDFIKNINDG